MEPSCTPIRKKSINFFWILGSFRLYKSKKSKWRFPDAPETRFSVPRQRTLHHVYTFHQGRQLAVCKHPTPSVAITFSEWARVLSSVHQLLEKTEPFRNRAVRTAYQMP